VLPALLKQATPLLDGTNPLHCRLGAVEAMATLMQTLQRQLVPYTVLLVVPLLRRMSDPAAAVRRRAALCFGGLTALLPLAQGLPLPQGLDDVQQQAAQQDAEFLSQLLDNKRVEDYTLPVKLKVWPSGWFYSESIKFSLEGCQISLGTLGFVMCSRSCGVWWGLV
jgi:TATA-binding protein-associated factor